MGNSDKQAENQIMPLMKGFPSKHRVKEEKGAIKNSGMNLSIKIIGHLTLFGMGVILLSQSCYKPFYGKRRTHDQYHALLLPAPRRWVLGILYEFDAGPPITELNSESDFLIGWPASNSYKKP